jgi:hypothetical protein
MEPFTASLVGALAAGAIAAAKDTATQAIKDTYAGIRKYIKDRYATVPLDGLDREPKSRGQQLVVQEKLDEAGAANDPDLPRLLKRFVEALKSGAPDAGKTVGVDLENIRAAIDVQIRRVGGEGPVTIKDVGASSGSVIVEDVGYQRKN